MMRAVVGDKPGNLDRVRRLAARAADSGSEVLVLPEACLTGYTVRESMKPWVEPVEGPLTEALHQIAMEYDLSILAGLVEADHGDKCYLTQVMVGPDGLIGAYRKTHLGPTEKTMFQAGKPFECHRLPGNSIRPPTLLRRPFPGGHPSPGPGRRRSHPDPPRLT